MGAPRVYCPAPLRTELVVNLPAGAARHVQVLRMQPGDALVLFDGSGGEFAAVIEHMGRSDVRVAIAGHRAVEREAPRSVQLALGVPANDRMDWLVEKATELGVTSIQPLITQHSVLRLSTERAGKKQAHWQAIAVAACEQCGRNRVPQVLAVRSFAQWLDACSTQAARVVLSFEGEALATVLARDRAPMIVLSGPEGGLAPQEEAQAVGRGFTRACLGSRVLRADTAPLAALALATLSN